MKLLLTLCFSSKVMKDELCSEEEAGSESLSLVHKHILAKTGTSSNRSIGDMFWNPVCTSNAVQKHFLLSPSLLER